MKSNFRGIFTAVLTPFDSEGKIVWDDFQQECEWIVHSGSHGFFQALPAND